MNLEAVAAECVEGAERRGAAWNLSVINLQSRYPLLDALADFFLFNLGGLRLICQFNYRWLPGCLRCCAP